MLLGFFDDNFYPGEVITVEGDRAKVCFMAPLKRKSGKELPKYVLGLAW